MGAVATTPEAVKSQFVQVAMAIASPDMARNFIGRVRTAAIRSVHANFQGSHDPDGNSWLALKHRRPNSKGADKPLLNFGFLEASCAPRGKGNIDIVTDRSFEFGTNMEYASTHQEGVPGPSWDGLPNHAKALAIPATKEASGFSPRDFPRKLTIIWPRGRKSGRLVEMTKPRRQDRIKGEIARHRKPINAFVRRKRAIIDRVKALRKQAKQRGAAPGNEANERFNRRIEREYAKLRRLESRTSSHVKKRDAEAAKLLGLTVTQYYLVKSVVIAARPFLGWGQPLLVRIDAIAFDVFRGTINGNLEGV